MATSLRSAASTSRVVASPQPALDNTGAQEQRLHHRRLLHGEEDALWGCERLPNQGRQPGHGRVSGPRPGVGFVTLGRRGGEHALAGFRLPPGQADDGAGRAARDVPWRGEQHAHLRKEHLPGRLRQVCQRSHRGDQLHAHWLNLFPFPTTPPPPCVERCSEVPGQTTPECNGQARDRCLQMSRYENKCLWKECPSTSSSTSPAPTPTTSTKLGVQVFLRTEPGQLVVQ